MSGVQRPRHPTLAGQPWSHATDDSVHRAFDILAGVIGVVLMAGLWYAGALTTLLSLAGLGLDLPALGPWAWVIPVGFSIIEVVYSVIKRQVRLPGYAVTVFWLVGGFDLASTFYGLFLWAPGRFIPLLTGFTIPLPGRRSSSCLR